MTIINRKKKQIITLAMLGMLVVLFCDSCVDKFERIDKYQRPDWLEGKIYTQISVQENMKLFTQFMVETGYDVVLDKTGTYTAFVPTDSAMEKYMMDKYGSIDPADVPLADKANIVKYHVLQMPWTIDQLQSLSYRGWISMSDVTNNEPNAFKRKTLLYEPNKTYKITSFPNASTPYDIITPSGKNRIVYNGTPKYVPLFFDGFLSSSDLGPEDYDFYFNQDGLNPYQSGEIYFAGAKMIGEEVFAENGLIYSVDKVVEPLRNGEQFLEEGDYSEFLQLIHNNSVFTLNEEATAAQEGAAEGKIVDDLYDLEYPEFPMNIHSEIVTSPTYTVSLNEGLMAPTNEAMDKFFNEYLTSRGDNWNAIPASIQRIFVKAHMAFYSIYKKDIDKGFYNANGDIVNADQLDFESIEYGSNCTFLGLKKAIVPEFFSNVCAPLFLDSRYNSLYSCYEDFSLFYILKNPEEHFSLFLINDGSLSSDSSLFVSTLPNGNLDIKAYDKGQEKLVSLKSSENKPVFLRKLYGQIGVQPILNNGAKRQFVETIDGRHIVIEGDTITGGAPSKFGFRSDSVVTVTFSKVESKFLSKNGETYDTKGWLSFPVQKTYRELEGTKFLELLGKAGLAELGNNQFTFLSSKERYTFFVPSDAALNNIQADTLSITDLTKLLKFHILRGAFVFTDGRAGIDFGDTYKTLGGDNIYLDSKPNKIDILDANKDLYYSIPTSKSSTDILGMYLENQVQEYYITNAVIHHVDTVIFPY